MLHSCSGVVLVAVLVLISCNVICMFWKSWFGMFCLLGFLIRIWGIRTLQLSDMSVMQHFTGCIAECCDVPALACRACDCLWVSGWQGESATCSQLPSETLTVYIHFVDVL